jgi:hypothetical protein
VRREKLTPPHTPTNTQNAATTTFISLSNGARTAARCRRREKHHRTARCTIAAAGLRSAVTAGTCKLCPHAFPARGAVGGAHAPCLCAAADAVLRARRFVPGSRRIGVPIHTVVRRADGRNRQHCLHSSGLATLVFSRVVVPDWVIRIRIQRFCPIWFQAKTELLMTISFSNLFEIKS